jgi:aminomethyltransferase
MNEPQAPKAHAAGELRQSPLRAFHLRHGGHLVPFAGWEMPLYFSSILAEHRAVRESVGLFDVSHMGILTLSGPTAADLLARRTTANVPELAPGQVRYTFFLEASGAIVDDLLVTRLDSGEDLARRYLVVPNAAHADEVDEILRQHRAPDTTIGRWNGKVAILAVQGPKSRALLESVFSWQLGGLGFYRGAAFPRGPGQGNPKGRLGFVFPDQLGEELFVSRTGYTGERGYEVFVPAAEADGVAERLVAAGAVPTGLGARDTLRLEQGYLLSGQDFHRDRTPLEAGQERFVDFQHAFVGKSALEKQREEGPKMRLVGLEVREPGAIPRHGTPVLVAGKEVARVTSGGLSPTLGYGVALAYLPPELTAPGTTVAFPLRGREVPAKVVVLPFRGSPTPGGGAG